MLDAAVLKDAKALLDKHPAIDLHVDTFIPKRLFGYDIKKTHAPPLRTFVGHVNLPRAQSGGLAGALWSITTNPFRSAVSRRRVFQKNLLHLKTWTEESGAAWTTTASAVDAAFAAQKHIVLPVVQGANCLGPDVSFAAVGAQDIVSATLIHLITSDLGETSTPLPMKPWWGALGLTTKGKEVVHSMNAENVLVDLAHTAPQTFWDAVTEHDRSKPLLVTHTGVKGVYDHWRNIDDAQMKAVADTGGVIGVIFHPGFLGKGSDNGIHAVMRHLQHIIDVVGEEHAALGSDWDGFITPPVELKDANSMKNLVGEMLQRGFSEQRIAGILGGNFLRCLRAVRP